MIGHIVWWWDRTTAPRLRRAHRALTGMLEHAAARTQHAIDTALWWLASGGK